MQIVIAWSNFSSFHGKIPQSISPNPSDDTSVYNQCLQPHDDAMQPLLRRGLLKKHLPPYSLKMVQLSPKIQKTKLDLAKEILTAQR